MRPPDLARLSKLMSLALRHRPQAFNLTLDAEGWVAVNHLVAGLTAKPGWAWLQADHIRHVVDTSAKQRFEIKGDNIRARYGHSRAARPTYAPVEPPPWLYHGTARRHLPGIRRDGLRAMRRQYVHLSATPEMARQVGRRHDSRPVLLVIRAADAYAAGIFFGTPSGQTDEVYLASTIPPQFIEFPE